MSGPDVPGVVDALPKPRSDDATESFWAAASDHRLVVQRCSECGRLQYPPDVCCITCQSESLGDVEVSGRGTIYSYAVAERVLHAGFVDALPYVVVLVELEEQSGLRVLANLVGPGADGGLVCGLPVVVTFEARGAAAIPQFRLADARVSSLARDVAVVGVGYSELSRAGEPNPRRLTLTAAKEALADSGLRGSDVDGVFEYKFGPESPGAQDVARMLGAPSLDAFADIMATGPSGLAGAMVGAMAVASGVCETVLVFRTMTRAAGYQGGVAAGPDEVGGRDQFRVPFGDVGGIIVEMALRKRRWMAEFDRPEDDFGRIAVNARRWSALNPRAVIREPLTMDDYLSSRMVVDPLRLFDCDYPVNGSVATILTTAERAADLRQTPVLVDAMAYGTGTHVDWAFPDDYLYGGTIECASRLWERASVTPADVDVAELYDGFTSVTISWIEALGACGIGEFGDWVGDGARLAPGGDYPLNTAGGQLAEGRLHGISFLNEAVLQLRGECGDRQVPDAEVAVVSSGLYPQCSAMVLTRG